MENDFDCELDFLELNNTWCVCSTPEGNVPFLSNGHSRQSNSWKLCSCRKGRDLYTLKRPETSRKKSMYIEAPLDWKKQTEEEKAK